jgi:hypothetical protein
MEQRSLRPPTPSFSISRVDALPLMLPLAGGFMLIGRCWRLA